MNKWLTKIGMSFVILLVAVFFAVLTLLAVPVMFLNMLIDDLADVWK